MEAAQTCRRSIDARNAGSSSALAFAEHAPTSVAMAGVEQDTRALRLEVTKR